MADNILQNSPSLVPTTQVWQLFEESQTANIDDELKRLFVNLHQVLNLMANVINQKDTGFYNTLEVINSQNYFSNPAYNSSTSQLPDLRSVYRKVINFGALPNATTKSVAHGITCTTVTTFTRIYGVASKTSTQNYLPLPYASATNVAHNIEVNVDGTNVNVITGTNYSSYATTYIILEYLQS